MDTEPSDFVSNALPDRSSVDRAARAAHEAIDKIAAKAGPAVEKVKSVAAGAAETLQAKASAIGALEEQWLANTRSYIRANPLTSVAIGLLAGALLAKLASRPR